MSRQNPLVIGINGHVLALDRASGAEPTGSIRWHNNLRGLGLGLISIGNDPTASAEFRRHQAAAAAGG